MHQLDVGWDVLGEAGHGDSEFGQRTGLIEAALRKLAAYDGPAVMVLLRDPDPKVLSARFGLDEDSRIKSAGLRDYGVGAQILIDLGVRDMIALSSSQPKPLALEGYGLKIVDWMGF